MSAKAMSLKEKIKNYAKSNKIEAQVTELYANDISYEQVIALLREVVLEE